MELFGHTEMEFLKKKQETCSNRVSSLDRKFRNKDGTAAVTQWAEPEPDPALERWGCVVRPGPTSILHMFGRRLQLQVHWQMEEWSRQHIVRRSRWFSFLSFLVNISWIDVFFTSR